MKSAFLLFSFLMIQLLVAGQAIRKINKVTTLQMPGRAGDNGGTVAVHGRTRNYYATIAGNKTFSLSIFNGLGERTSPADLAVLYDVRGLWYNQKAKTFYANGFGKNGWCRYVMDDEGIPYDVAPLFEGQQQPFPQSSGAYYQKENIVYFLKGATAVAYDGETGKELADKRKVFKPGFTVKNPPPANYIADTSSTLKGYNNTSLIYTGLSNNEFGLLNVDKREIELYSAATGLLMTRLQLPPEAAVRDKLNFAFCNGVYWLYDAGSRSWVGYR
jgi:hypothetical protein